MNRGAGPPRRPGEQPSPPTGNRASRLRQSHRRTPAAPADVARLPQQQQQPPTQEAGVSEVRSNSPPERDRNRKLLAGACDDREVSPSAARARAQYAADEAHLVSSARGRKTVLSAAAAAETGGVRKAAARTSATRVVGGGGGTTPTGGRVEQRQPQTDGRQGQVAADRKAVADAVSKSVRSGVVRVAKQTSAAQAPSREEPMVSAATAAQVSFDSGFHSSTPHKRPARQTDGETRNVRAKVSSRKEASKNSVADDNYDESQNSVKLNKNVLMNITGTRRLADFSVSDKRVPPLQVFGVAGSTALAYATNEEGHHSSKSSSRPGHSDRKTVDTSVPFEKKTAPSVKRISNAASSEIATNEINLLATKLVSALSRSKLPPSPLASELFNTRPISISTSRGDETSGSASRLRSITTSNKLSTTKVESSQSPTRSKLPSTAEAESERGTQAAGWQAQFESRPSTHLTLQPAEVAAPILLEHCTDVGREARSAEERFFEILDGTRTGTIEERTDLANRLMDTLKKQMADLEEEHKLDEQKRAEQEATEWINTQSGTLTPEENKRKVLNERIYKQGPPTLIALMQELEKKLEFLESRFADSYPREGKAGGRVATPLGTDRSQETLRNSDFELVSRTLPLVSEVTRPDGVGRIDSQSNGRIDSRSRQEMRGDDHKTGTRRAEDERDSRESSARADKRKRNLAIDRWDSKTSTREPSVERGSSTQKLSVDHEPDIRQTNRGRESTPRELNRNRDLNRDWSEPPRRETKTRDSRQFSQDRLAAQSSQEQFDCSRGPMTSSQGYISEDVSMRSSSRNLPDLRELEATKRKSSRDMLEPRGHCGAMHRVIENNGIVNRETNRIEERISRDRLHMIGRETANEKRPNTPDQSLSKREPRVETREPSLEIREVRSGDQSARVLISHFDSKQREAIQQDHKSNRHSRESSVNERRDRSREPVMIRDERGEAKEPSVYQLEPNRTQLAESNPFQDGRANNKREASPDKLEYIEWKTKRDSSRDLREVVKLEASRDRLKLNQSGEIKQETVRDFRETVEINREKFNTEPLQEIKRKSSRDVWEMQEENRERLEPMHSNPPLEIKRDLSRGRLTNQGTNQPVTGCEQLDPKEFGEVKRESSRNFRETNRREVSRDRLEQNQVGLTNGFLSQEALQQELAPSRYQLNRNLRSQGDNDQPEEPGNLETRGGIFRQHLPGAIRGSRDGPQTSGEGRQMTGQELQGERNIIASAVKVCTLPQAIKVDRTPAMMGGDVGTPTLDQFSQTDYKQAIGLDGVPMLATPPAQIVARVMIDASVSAHLDDDDDDPPPEEEAPPEEEPPAEEEAPPEEPPPEEPAAEESPPEEPAAEESPPEEPAAEESPPEEPTAEESPPEEPAVEESPPEEPAAEESPTEEPAVEETPPPPPPPPEPEPAPLVVKASVMVVPKFVPSKLEVPLTPMNSFMTQPTGSPPPGQAQQSSDEVQDKDGSGSKKKKSGPSKGDNAASDATLRHADCDCRPVGKSSSKCGKGLLKKPSKKEQEQEKRDKLVAMLKEICGCSDESSDGGESGDDDDNDDEMLVCMVDMKKLNCETVTLKESPKIKEIISCPGEEEGEEPKKKCKKKPCGKEDGETGKEKKICDNCGDCSRQTWSDPCDELKQMELDTKAVIKFCPDPALDPVFGSNRPRCKKSVVEEKKPEKKCKLKCPSTAADAEATKKKKKQKKKSATCPPVCAPKIDCPPPPKNESLKSCLKCPSTSKDALPERDLSSSRSRSKSKGTSGKADCPPDPAATAGQPKQRCCSANSETCIGSKTEYGCPCPTGGVCPGLTATTAIACGLAVAVMFNL